MNIFSLAIGTTLVVIAMVEIGTKKTDSWTIFRLILGIFNILIS